jgi:hypothetical protein
MADSEGYIYFFNARGTDRYKIGRTNNIGRRTKELNGKQAPTPIDLLWSRDVGRAVSAENELKLRFKRWNVHKEWYEFDRSDLGEIERAYNDVAAMYPAFYDIDWASAGADPANSWVPEDYIGIDWSVESAEDKPSKRGDLDPGRDNIDGLNQFLLFIAGALTLAFIVGHGRMSYDQRCIDPNCANPPAQAGQAK